MATDALSIALRRRVRVALSVAARAGRKAVSLEVIRAGIEALGFPLSTDAEIASLREAMEWNQSRGLIDYSWNAELEIDEWFLTERGRTHE
jgi:hypothetical protein